MKGNGEALIDLPAEPAPIAAGSVRVLWPKDLPVKWKAFGKGIAPVESDRNGYRILTQSHPLVKQEEMPEDRSEEHTSELQSLMRSSYAVFCLKKKKQSHKTHTNDKKQYPK